MLITRGMKLLLGVCLVYNCVNNHHHCICYYHQCSLHHICASQINHDDVHKGLEIVFGDKDIHSSSAIAREKVGNLLLNMCSTLQSNSYDSILKCIMGCCVFILARALKQMGI